jgi:hypothetical protein
VKLKGYAVEKLDGHIKKQNLSSCRAVQYATLPSKTIVEGRSKLDV